MNPIGTTVGRIRIIETLGKGGMGEVYVGWDEKLQRKVALKAIRHDQRLDAEAKARFLREARILSQLDHPGICRIYELIEADDSDFLVLELIEGQSLRIALKEGLEPSHKLFVAEKVAAALAAAHAKGVVHRDLKPDNVMLTDDGLVKVLDFGLARTVDAQLPADASQDETVDPRERVATDAANNSGPTFPDWGVWEPTTRGQAPPTGHWSPEESKTKVPAATTDRASVDSVSADSGVLFETQRGTVMGTIGYMNPEQARGERATAAGDMYSYGLMLQEILTGSPAYPPGLKALEMLIRVAEGETLPVTGLDPDLTALIHRLKAMAPEARPSAIECVERLWWIRGKRRRHLQRLLAIAAVVALLLGGLKYTYDLRREQNLAIAARSEAEQVSAFLMDIFKVSDPETARGNEITARELLDAGAGRIDQLHSHPLQQARMMLTMGQIYRQLGFYEQALPLLEKALVIRQRERGEDLETVGYIDQLASLYHDLGSFAQAEPLFQRALDIRQRTLGNEHSHVAASLNNLAFLYRARGDVDRAEPLFRQALKIQQKNLGMESPQVANTLNNLGDLYRVQGEHSKAASILQYSIEVQERVLGNDHPDLADSLNNLAMVFHEQGDVSQAEPLYQRTLAIVERVLGDEHANVAISLNNLAELYRATGHHGEAEPLYLRALEIQEKALGATHPNVAITLANLADLMSVRGDAERAESLYERALAIQKNALGPEHPSVAVTLNHQADLFVAHGGQERSEALYLQALGIQEKAFGRHHFAVIVTLCDLADLRLHQGRYDEAETLYLGSWNSLAEVLRQQPGSRALLARQAAIAIGQGKLAAVEGSAERAAEHWQQALAILAPFAETTHIVSELDLYARALIHLGEVDRARPIVARLLETGWRRGDFLDLVRAHELLSSADLEKTAPRPGLGS